MAATAIQHMHSEWNRNTATWLTYPMPGSANDCADCRTFATRPLPRAAREALEEPWFNDSEFPESRNERSSYGI